MTFLRHDIFETWHFWDMTFLRQELFEAWCFWDMIFLRQDTANDFIKIFQQPCFCNLHFFVKSKLVTMLFISDEFQLEFSSSSPTKLGHFNFLAEFKLTILIICMSKNCKFFWHLPQVFSIRNFYIWRQHANV